MHRSPRGLHRPGGSLAPGLRIGTHNPGHGGLNNKWAAPSGRLPGMSKLQGLLHLWQVELHLDIICLQELWMRAADVAGRQAIQLRLDAAAQAGGLPRLVALWAPSAHDASAGVAILVKAAIWERGDLTIYESTVTSAPDGRLMHMSCAWGGHRFHLVNVYLPSGDPEGQQAFITDRLGPLLEDWRGPIILLGDFNFTDDWRVDRTNGPLPPPPPPPPAVRRSLRLSQQPPGPPTPAPAAVAAAATLPQTLPVPRRSSRTAEARTAAAMQQLCRDRSLHDAFRSRHPTRQAFTYVCHNAASRLDRIYVSQALLPHVHQCHIATVTESDHRPVVLHLRRLTPSSTGRGTPCLRQRFRSPALVTRFTQKLEELLATAPLANPPALLQWWPGFKTDVAALITLLNRQQAREAAQPPADEQVAKAALDVAFEALDTAAHPDAILAPVLAARRQYMSACAPRAAKAEREARTAWLATGERPCPLLTSLTRPPQASRLIPVVRSPGGGLLTDGPLMAQHVAEFWAGVSAAPPQDAAAVQQVLDAVRLHAVAISPAAAEQAGTADIVAASVAAVVKRCASGKAPGPDGLPMEFWRNHIGLLAPVLAAVYSAIGAIGAVPASFLDGVVHPFHKAGDAADPANYRPITLLNTDYRLLAKILAARMGPVLAAAIGPEQTAFLPGRLIGDNITLLQLLPQQLRRNAAFANGLPSSVAVALLDFRKAYDTVSRPFLLAVMEAVGAGAGLLAWARIVLGDTSAAADVNGHVSGMVRYDAGVRQGCPLAPLLYLFVAWALACWLKTCPAVGVEVRRGEVIHGDQYADDAHPLLKSHAPHHVLLFLAAMATFARASGQHLNLSKTHILLVGDLAALGPLPTESGGLRVVPHATSLGVTFSNNTSEPNPLMDWEPRMTAVRQSFSKLAKLPLSIFGRAMAGFGYGTSRILYHAEHSAMPAASTQLHLRWTSHLTDRGNPPPSPPATYPLHPLPGVHTRLLVGKPKDGGFGAIPMAAHILARGAASARRYIAWEAGDPSVLLPGRLRKLMDAMERSRGTMELTLEDTLLLTVRPCRPLWIGLATDLIHHSCPSCHPVLALLSAALTTGEEAVSHRLPAPLHAAHLPDLPMGPITRMVAGLRALGPPLLVSPFTAVPGAWCSSVPLWGNPLLQLEHPETQRTVPWPVSLLPLASVPPRPPAPRAPPRTTTTPPPIPSPSPIITPHPPSPPHLPPPPPPPPVWIAGFGEFRRQHAGIRTLGDAVRLHRHLSGTGSILPGRGHTLFHPILANVAALLSALPPSWVEMARSLPAHASGVVNPALEEEAVRLAISRLGWPSPLPSPLLPPPPGRKPPAPICLVDSSFSVRSATAIQLAGDFTEQRSRRLEFTLAALTAGAPPVPPAPATVTAAATGLEASLSTLWGISWDNSYKETLWRLLVNGVSGAGGHDIPHTGPCQCGWAPPARDPARVDDSKHRAYALRLHCFWECPVAQAVVAELQRGLPAREAPPPLSPADVWLLQPPAGRTVHPGIWAFVCMVALHAMELGRRHLWSAALRATAVGPPAQLVASASRVASAWMWCLLQDFVDLHEVPEGWGGKLGTSRHPFIGIARAAGVEAAPGDRCLRLNLPIGFALPPDLDLVL